ncbi:hypothetical protein DFI_14795 (plasmid) [Deinococcus ficus]|uniref:Uncharacterized protein n=1 Tax=Deinococcus ficus TaxID=317577 RepID=A0A221T0P2_9DEIO|nr:hypothetical protein DFI_14795 [Deinococcus ficus]
MPLTAGATSQLRYWARVDLLTFELRFETRFRRCVTTVEFSQVLAWGQTRMATTVLEAGLNAEQAFTAKSQSGITG